MSFRDTEVISGLDSELFYIRRHSDGTLKRESVLYMDNFQFDVSQEELVKNPINSGSPNSYYRGGRAVRGSFSVKSLLDLSKLLNPVGTNYLDNGAALKKIGTQAATWVQSSGVIVDSNRGFNEFTRIFEAGRRSWYILDTNAGTSESLVQRANIPMMRSTLWSAGNMYTDAVVKNLFFRFAIELVSGCVTARVYGYDKSGNEVNILLQPIDTLGTQIIILPVDMARVYDNFVENVYVELTTAYNAASTVGTPIPDPTNNAEAYVTNIVLTDASAALFVERSAVPTLDEQLFIQYNNLRSNGDYANIIFVGVVVNGFGVNDAKDVNMESVTFAACDYLILDSNVKADDENWNNWYPLISFGA